MKGKAGDEPGKSSKSQAREQEPHDSLVNAEESGYGGE
jgi:hypothetical protein